MTRPANSVAIIRILIVVLILLIIGFYAWQAFAQEPTAAELSKKETVSSAFLRGFKYQEYEVRSAAEAMPEDKYDYRPAAGLFKNEKPEYGPSQVRTFAEQVKHVACSNFAFAAEFDGAKPPERCDMGGPSPAKTKRELLIYLRDSFAAVEKSLGNINEKTCSIPSKALMRARPPDSTWRRSSSGTPRIIAARW